jgi:hypothetical protein
MEWSAIWIRWGTEKGKKDVLQEEEGTSPEQSEKQTLLASTTQTAECQ